MTDHPTKAYFNPGHALNAHQEEFTARQRARVYSAWDPPSKGADRNGKKIVRK